MQGVEKTVKKGVGNEIGEIYYGVIKPMYRPVFLVRVQAGFPSPADDYICGRISIDKDFIKHPLSTFYVRSLGDSMEPYIFVNSLMMVDRAEEAVEGDIVIAAVNRDLCVKQLSFGDDGRIYLLSTNSRYKPIEIGEDDDFEVWGVVITTLHPLRGRDRVQIEAEFNVG